MYVFCCIAALFLLIALVLLVTLPPVPPVPDDWDGGESGDDAYLPNWPGKASPQPLSKGRGAKPQNKWPKGFDSTKHLNNKN